MKKVIGVVLHQGGNAFQVEVRQRDTGYDARWSCKACRREGVSPTALKDADEAFERAKQMVAAHKCDEHAAATG